MDAKSQTVEQDNERLGQEIEELRAGFIVQKEELEDEYQKQVDDIFFIRLPVLHEET